MSNTQQPTTEDIELPPYPNVSPPLYPPRVLTTQDFITQVEKTLCQIRTLASNIPNIETLHAEILSTRSTEREQGRRALLNQEDEVNILIQAIHDHLRALKADAEETTRVGGFDLKKNQILAIVPVFKAEVMKYSHQVSSYGHDLRQHLTRQYLILNPEATNDEVESAAERDWSRDEVFRDRVSLVPV